MTREEAIFHIKELQKTYASMDKKVAEAVDMAIDALSAKSEQTIRHIENNTKESDLVYRPSADDTFCKSQLITCNRVKECNGVCPFEDALKHADKMQTMNDQHTVGHDREWIIGCIEHDGFIHTHRFDKANQIIHDALSAEAVPHGRLIDADRLKSYIDCGHLRPPTEVCFSELDVCNMIDKAPTVSAEAVQGWIPFKKRPLTDEEKQEYPDWTYIFDCPLPDDEEEILLSNGKYVWTDTFINDGECYLDGGDDIDDGMAWMPLPEPYKGGEEE